MTVSYDDDCVPVVCAQMCVRTIDKSQREEGPGVGSYVTRKGVVTSYMQFCTVPMLYVAESAYYTEKYITLSYDENFK
jgi:hypothetical protein